MRKNTEIVDDDKIINDFKKILGIRINKRQKEGLNSRSYDYIEIDGKVISLSLSKRNIEDLTILKGLEKLIHLETLKLTDCKISELKGLENLTHLKTLTLYGNQITEIKGLESLKNLTSLHFSHNNIVEMRGRKFSYVVLLLPV